MIEQLEDLRLGPEPRSRIPRKLGGYRPGTRCSVAPLEETGTAALKIHHNEHEGKLGILCLAPREGLGIDDPAKRASIGEDKITLFRGR